MDIPPVSALRHEISRIVFPTGLVDRGEHYIMSYGHEDRVSGVATLDKEALLKP